MNQTIRWAPLPDDPESPWSSFSLLVDDIERYSGTALEYALDTLNGTIPHFFRLAVSHSPQSSPLQFSDPYVKFKSDSQTGDFTNAATLWPNGTWVDPLPGASY